MPLWRFDRFELDTSAGELRKDGRRVPLRPQPCAALGYLVERHGQFVSRSELFQALWPEGVYVHFDHGLNSCVKQVRAALGDSRAAPRFIETLTRRGYRFIAAAAPLASSTPRDLRPRLRVMPVRTLDPGGAAVAEALAEEVVARLATDGASVLLVLADANAIPGVEIQAPVPDFILTASVRTAPGRVRMTVRLVDAREGCHLWAARYDRPLDRPLEAQAAIAEKVAGGAIAAVNEATRRRCAGQAPVETAKPHGVPRLWRIS